LAWAVSAAHSRKRTAAQARDWQKYVKVIGVYTPVPDAPATSLGFAAGLEFRKFLALELEYVRREIQGEYERTVQSPFVKPVQIDANIALDTVFIHGLVKFPNPTRFTLWAGAGLGLARVQARLTAQAEINIPGLPPFIPPQDLVARAEANWEKINWPAWDVLAGLDIRLLQWDSGELFTGIAARYLDCGPMGLEDTLESLDIPSAWKDNQDVELAGYEGMFFIGIKF
ncbi:MAG: hypothetical protein SVS15_07020, partial [Thermodesulfobacteriota bacterium]|nr:hypothetical protein [Thermodesulfobacteriota bacterium]